MGFGVIDDGTGGGQVCEGGMWAVSESSACVWEELHVRKMYLLWAITCAAWGRKGTTPCAC